MTTDAKLDGRVQELIVEAVARAWCHDKNAHKEMDVDLAYAAVDEVMAALRGLDPKPTEQGATLRLRKLAARLMATTEFYPDAHTVLEAEISLQRPTEQGWVSVPREPERERLISMAVRLDHGFGLLSEREQEAAITDMKQVYEEASGQGFYSPETADRYRAMLAAAPSAAGRESNGG